MTIAQKTALALKHSKGEFGSLASLEMSVMILPDAPKSNPPEVNPDYSNGPTTNRNLIGPTQGASMPENDTLSTPQSPYTATRALIHDLTLPTFPNFDIPPSPPGSPLHGMDAKFNHFLLLKKQGVHFNEKLAHSSALKNPSLLQKLMDFAGVEDGDQYATTLPKDVWDPLVFPAWAFKEELAKRQQEFLKKREEAKARQQRESIEFVSPAGLVKGVGGSASESGSKGFRVSAVERVMAGLDRDRMRSPAAGNGGNLPERKHEGLQHRPNPRKRSRSR